MTEDEDDDSHGGAMGATHILDHPTAAGETDDGSWSDSHGESSPWLPDLIGCTGSTACKPEVGHVNQECVRPGKLRNPSSTDGFVFVSAEEFFPEPNSSDQTPDTTSSQTDEKSQGVAEPLSRSAVTEGHDSKTSTEETSVKSAAKQQHSYAHLDNVSCPHDDCSLASGQCYTTAESSVCNRPPDHSGSQSIDDPCTPIHPPLCKLSPFRPVSTPSASSPALGSRSKSPPKSMSSSKQVSTMELRSNENRSLIHGPQPSCPETVCHNHSKLLETTSHVVYEHPEVHAPVIRLGIPNNSHIKHAPAHYASRPISYRDITSGTPAPLLTYALKHFISPQDVKLFNIEYYQQRSPQLFRNFVEFCGQGANGLTCLIYDLETSQTCKACTLLQNNLKPLNILIRNPRCMVYNKQGPDATLQDAILTVVSAGAGLVRLVPICPAIWEQWAHFPMDDDDGDKCFVKTFTQTVKRGNAAHLHAEIRQCITCLQWPHEIAKDFTERTRESNWLDQRTLEDITRDECRVMPYLQRTSSRQDIDWQLIFPKAERRLADVLTDEQRQCFYIFQLVMQHHLLIIPYAEVNINAISQVLMHLDHVLFHACDIIQDHMWKASLGYCFLVIVQMLDQFVHDRHLPHYIVRNRNMLHQLSVTDFRILEAATREMLGNPLRVFQNLSENHQITNAWILNELSLCNRLIGGHGTNINNERVLLPLALRLSKEFMRMACPQKAYECLEDMLNEVATSETDGNNPYTTDVRGFFARIANSEKDVSFLCRLSVYTKLSQSIDISSVLPDFFTSLQGAVGPSYQLGQEIEDLPFPKFTDDRVQEKVLLLEELAFQLTHHSDYPHTSVALLMCTFGIAARAIDNLKANDMREHAACGGSQDSAMNAFTQYSSACATASEEEILTENPNVTRPLDAEACAITDQHGIVADAAISTTTTTSTNTRAEDGHTYKVVKSLRESQFRCLWNLFRCYEVHHCPETFETHLDELERLCEQLGDPSVYTAFSKILYRLGHVHQAQQANDMAQIRDNVKFGV